VTLTIWPSIVWRTARISPRPPQAEQGADVLPGAAPLPAHVPQRSRASNSISRSIPRTASSKEIRRS